MDFISFQISILALKNLQITCSTLKLLSIACGDISFVMPRYFCLSAWPSFFLFSFDIRTNEHWNCGPDPCALTVIGSTVILYVQIELVWSTIVFQRMGQELESLLFLFFFACSCRSGLLKTEYKQFHLKWFKNFRWSNTVHNFRRTKKKWVFHSYLSFGLN